MCPYWITSGGASRAHHWLLHHCTSLRITDENWSCDTPRLSSIVVNASAFAVSWTLIVLLQNVRRSIYYCWFKSIIFLYVSALNKFALFKKKILVITFTLILELPNRKPEDRWGMSRVTDLRSASRINVCCCNNKNIKHRSELRGKTWPGPMWTPRPVESSHSNRICLSY